MTPIQTVTRIARALGDASRVRILGCLRDGKPCVCQVTELLRLALPTISEHLAIPKDSGLLQARKDGRWKYYGLAGDDAPRLVHDAIRWVEKGLSNDKRAVEDVRRLKQIIRVDPEVLCCQQRNGARNSKTVHWRKRGRRAT